MNIDDTLQAIAIEYNKATIYLNKGNVKKAIPIFKKCLSQLKFREAYINLGNAYREQGLYKLSMETYREGLHPSVGALGDDASLVQATNQLLNNLGLAYYAFGNDAMAQKCYNKALKSNPKFWEIWWNASTSILREASTGEIELFSKGWEMYDARFLKNPPIVLKNNNPDLVYWDTTSSGDSIVVLVEQGIGDAIMFGRYLPLLAEKFKKVYVQCDPSLEALFADYHCIRDAVEVDVTVGYPICSLAKCFNNGVPVSGAWLKGKFNARSFPTDRLNIGVVWAGSNTHTNNANRSVPVGRFSRLAKYANLYSLSPDFTGNKYIQPLGIKTWTDTAECINGLDLVISVDTSVIHLCGSLGCEGWVLQPKYETDFRWGNGSKSVWYDTITVFQNENSWDGVFDAVELALKERLYEKC